MSPIGQKVLLFLAILPFAGGCGHGALADASAPERNGDGLWTNRPPIVDAHAHLSLSGLTRIRTIIEDNDIALFFNLSGGNQSRGMRSALELAKLLPDRVVNFYNPDWSRFGEPDFGVIEATRLKEAVERFGYGGLKISKHLGLGLRWPSGALVAVDDPVLDPLWAMAGALRIPVAIHTGDPKAFFEHPSPENERWAELSVHPNWSFADPSFPSRDELLAARDRVLDRHPVTTFIAVHFANNPENLDYVEHVLETYPNALVDTSARVPELGRHPPERVRALFEKYADRILFGTDIGVYGRQGLMLGSTGDVPSVMADVVPFYDKHFEWLETRHRDMVHMTPIQGDWTIDAIGLPTEVLRKVYVENARRVLRTGF